MEVIPLTLALSLLLSLTFIALFLREFTRPQRAGAEHDSLLPLEPDLVRAPVARQATTRTESPSAATPHDHHHEHAHKSGEACSGGKPGAACCNSCQRRRERQEQRAGASTAAPRAGLNPDTAPAATPIG